MSTNAEPIPGAVPPDISKPLPPKEPTPPPPETPQKGIEVEVYQPEIIYKAVSEYLNDPMGEKGQGFCLYLGNRNWESSTIQDTSVYLNGVRREGENMISPMFYIDMANLDSNYYGDERITSIQQMFIAKGYDANHEKGKESEKVPWHSLLLTKDGQSYSLVFGYGSRADELKAFGYALGPRIEESLRFPISFLTSPGIALKTAPETIKLGEQQEFVDSITRYASVSEDVINILYKEAGTEPPRDKTLILRPPILNQDTMTEIASSGTETPTRLVVEQIKKEMPSFEDIAGQDVAVAEAKRLVLAINHPEVFEKRGVKRPKGILFYGPPGTGKTLIAKAVARETKADFFEVSVADIGRKWYGESVRLMQEVFNRANKAVEGGRKVVIFFDELDSLAPTREDVHEETKKVVATLLQNMDGMRANPNVTVIAASNRPQDIDPALKRPGRIDKLIHVGLPSSEGRSAILKIHIEKAKKTAKAPGELFSAEINLEQLGQATDGMSGADLANLVNLVLEDKVMAELEGSAWTPVSTEEMVSTAKRLGLLKEEKRRIGFIQPHQNDGATTTGAIGK